MPITSIDSDTQTLTMTVIGDYPVAVDRLWEAYADPRQLEKFWGPESWPATFTRHDLAPGSRVDYHMTGPEGDEVHGYWDVLETELPIRAIHTTLLHDGRLLLIAGSGNDGNLFLPNNGPYIERDNGTIWQPWGPIFPMTPPVLFAEASRMAAWVSFRGR